MNKQLQRDLLSSIQSLTKPQLSNFLQHYSTLSTLAHKWTVTKAGICYQCEAVFGSLTVKGFGRTQEQAVGNGVKNALSGLIVDGIEVGVIRDSLKFKNGGSAVKTFQYGTGKKSVRDQTLGLDQFSVIEHSHSSETKTVKNSCDCIYYQTHKYNENEIKHLQARISLLSEQNILLKKMLFCNNPKSKQLKDFKRLKETEEFEQSEEFKEFKDSKRNRDQRDQRDQRDNRENKDRGQDSDCVDKQNWAGSANVVNGSHPRDESDLGKEDFFTGKNGLLC